jgi:RuvB-like protein 2
MYQPYTEDWMHQILDIRGEEEDVGMPDEAKELLTKIGFETSLRYAIHLITTAALACQERKGKLVDIVDVSRVYQLFVDIKRSTRFLMEYQEQLMFNEVPGEIEEGSAWYACYTMDQTVIGEGSHGRVYYATSK